MAGVRYYVEVLHKEGNQNDNLSVWWSKPGESTTAPAGAVPASSLSPFIIPSKPAAPSNLTATPISATQVDLSWTDNSNNENGFRIERSSGGGAFVEVGITAPNATTYHDAGLIATTQYQYQIRSFNDLGNSTSYSNTISAITLASMAMLSQPEELHSFAVYSSEKTVLSSQAMFNGGGAVGSNDSVEVFAEAVVNGNVISGNHVILRSSADVNGTVKAAGTVTIESGATADVVEEGATVAVITIPEKTTIPVGTIDSVIPGGVNCVLPPGCYKNFTVTTGGTLTLSEGQYTFANLFLQPEAKIVLAVVEMAEMIDVAIAGDLEFSDRSQVLFSTKGYVPFIRFYTNDANTVRIGCDVILNGTLIAPHAHIAMFSRAACNGAIYGKTVTVEPNAIIYSDMTDPEKDSDGDGVANVLEVFLGTDPADSNSFIPIAIPSQAWISNPWGGSVTISYDYSHFYRNEHPTDTAVQITYDPLKMTNPNIPPIIRLSNTPDTGEVFNEPGFEARGRYYVIDQINPPLSGETITIDLPIVRSIDNGLPTWFFREGDITTSWKGAWAPPNGNDGESELPEGGGSSGSVPVEVGSNGNTFLPTNRIKGTNTTLYFDNGIVFTRNSNVQLRYNFQLKDNYDVTVTADIEYTNLTTGTVEHIPLITLDPAVINEATPFPYYYAEGTHVFTDPVLINRCTFTIVFTGEGGSHTYVQDFGAPFSITSGKTMQMVCGESIGSLCNPISRNRIAAYFAQDFEFESASFGEGRILTAANGGVAGQPYTYEYFLTDHLGSTRMVMNDQHTVSEAIMYQPYGKMESIGGLTGALDVREKFTTKEFDQDGAAMGKLDFQMNFGFGQGDPIQLDREKWNAVAIYYTDYGTAAADAVADIVMLDIDEAHNLATAKAELNYTSDKQIKWIHIVLNGVFDANGNLESYDVACAITPINEGVGPNNAMTINKDVATSGDLYTTIGQEHVLGKDYLDYPTVAYNGVDGIGLFYFGARYYVATG